MNGNEDPSTNAEKNIQIPETNTPQWNTKTG